MQNLSELGRKITEAMETAEEQSEQIRGKDVLLLIGCTGAGKTTAAVYALGGCFTLDEYGSNLSLTYKTEHFQRFEIGDSRRSTTRGLNAAEMPDHAVHLCDLAGTHDTESFVMDISACILKAVVLRKARSVRVALVMSAGSYSIQQRRGKPAVEDLVTVAGMFKEVSHHLDSIGLVLTDWAEVGGKGAVRELGKATAAFQQLAKDCKVVEHGWELAEGGMEITPDGQELLQRVRDRLQVVADARESFRVGDEFFVEELLKRRIPVWPLNVLSDSQRSRFGDFLAGLTPVHDPHKHMKCELPEQEKNKLETVIMEASHQVTRVIFGTRWARERECRCDVVNLLALTTVLRDLKLFAVSSSDGLCTAGRLVKLVCDRLCETNGRAVQDGARFAGAGNHDGLSETLLAMREMDDFRKELQAAPVLEGKVELEGWTPRGLFLEEAAKTVQTALEGQLPDGVQARVTAESARIVDCLLACAGMLASAGAEVLSRFAERLSSDVDQLECAARACACPASVTAALGCLAELAQNFDEPRKRLQRNGCRQPIFQDGGLAAALVAAKAGVISRLEELSKQAITERRDQHLHGERDSASWKLLRSLCNSTELQQFLEDGLEPGEELTQRFLFVPFSEAFAPSQEAIDVLVECMQDSKYQWSQLCVGLNELVHKILGLGDLGRKTVETRGLRFGDFFQEVKRSAVRDRDELVRFVQLVKDKARRQSPSDENRTVISSRSDDEEEEERNLHRRLDDDCDTAKKALERLSKLTVADTLFHVAPPGTPAPNVGAMLVAAVDHMEENLTSQRKKADDLRDIEGGQFCVVGRASLRDLMVLKVFLGAAKQALESLQHLQTKPERLVEALQSSVVAAGTLIRDFIKQQTDEWAKSSVEQRDWMKHIHQHLQNAKRFELLDPTVVVPAKRQLREKVGSWRETCRKEAETAKNERRWATFIDHAVLGGLAFESSPLGADAAEGEFYAMVAEAVQQWTPGVGAGASGAVSDGLDPEAGEQLKALHVALQHLLHQSRRQGSNVGQLLDTVKGALAPHLAQEQSHVQEFRAALDRKDFLEAVEKCVSNPRRILELQKGLVKHVDSLMDKLDTAAAGTLDVGDISQAKRLLKELDRISRGALHLGEDLQQHVQRCRESVQQQLENLKKWAKDAGQQSLCGRCDAKVPLDVSVAVTGDKPEIVAQSMIDCFTAIQKEALGQREAGQLDKLMRWLRIHDKVRQQLPECFRSSVTAWDELMMLVVERLKEELNPASLEQALNRKRWNDAKNLCASFRGTIGEIKRLSIMTNFVREFEDVENNLRVLGGRSTTDKAKSEVPNGIFKCAIWVIVTGSPEDAIATCALVMDEMRDNLSLVAGAGVRSVAERLRRLRAFQSEVGSDPPNFLANISRQVEYTLEVELPRIEVAAKQELGKVQTAARQDDLARLAQALQSYETVQGCDADSGAQVGEAVRQFWLNLQAHMSKTLGDVSPQLNVAALTTNLVPVKQWLRAFEHLGEPHRILLLPSLRDVAEQPSLGGLREWLGHLLQPAMASLASLAEELAQRRRFKELSDCYRSSELLGEVIRQPALDLTPVAREVQKAHEDALKALEPTVPEWSNFRAAYQLLQAADEGFPGLPGAKPRDARLAVEQMLREKVFTEQLGKRLQAVTTLADAREAIISFRLIGEWVPELLRMVNEHLKQGLKQLKNNNPQFNTAQEINALGGLLNVDQLGRMVCAEQPQVFSVASDIALNETLRQSEERHKHTFIHQLTERTGLGHHENSQLQHAWRQFQTEFERLKVKLLLQKDITFPQAQALARQELDLAVQRSDMELLTTVVACYSVVKCGEAFIGRSPKEQSDIFFQPHVGQVLALFRLLQVHQHPQGGGSHWLGRFTEAVVHFAGKVGMCSQQQDCPLNQLVQMQTGEGKCLTLGLLATFLALKGIACDIVCYQRLLVDQDRDFMMPFYAFAGVEDKIRYMTFDDLCEERLTVLQSATREMLESGKSPPPKVRLDTRQRALLIDEVDVFFSEGFYGQIYNGAFKVMGPEAEALIRFIWEEKMEGRCVSNVTQTQQFLDLRKRYPNPELQEALACAAESLATNVNDWNTPMASPDFVNGRVGYHGADEVDYGLAYENKTVFVYLNYLGEGKFTEEQVRPHLGLDLVCGRFSFAEIPRTYLCNLGVTGTLSQLMGQAVVKKVAEPSFKHPVKQILWDEYQFRHFTELPSIYGQRDANLDFKLEDHAFVLDDEKTWAQKIEAVIQEQRSRPQQGSQHDNAVLVFCETAKDFDRLALEMQQFQKNYERLSEDLDLDRRQELIKAATTSGRVTLVTKAFGRGIDFAMPNTHVVVVIQTFLSPLLSEEVQIMGRTARRGKSGRYLLVLCAQHLKEKFGVTDDDLGKMKLSKVDTAQILKERQAQTAEKKVRAMIARRKAAWDLELETRDWEKLLFDPARPVEDKLQRLARWNMEHFKQIHYTLILDCSSSMDENRWKDLVKAFNAFLRALQEMEARGVASGTAKVSVVFFATNAKIMEPHHVRPMEVQDIGDKPFSGGTNFDEAFAMCYQVIRESTSATREAILFLTDGEGNRVPQGQIKQLLDDHGSRIETFTCIGFNVRSTSQLDQIRALFAAQSGIVAHPVKNPGNEADLVQTFKDAAHSREVRHGQWARTAR